MLRSAAPFDADGKPPFRGNLVSRIPSAA